MFTRSFITGSHNEPMDKSNLKSEAKREQLRRELQDVINKKYTDALSEYHIVGRIIFILFVGALSYMLFI